VVVVVVGEEAPRQAAEVAVVASHPWACAQWPVPRVCRLGLLSTPPCAIRAVKTRRCEDSAVCHPGHSAGLRRHCIEVRGGSRDYISPSVKGILQGSCYSYYSWPCDPA